MRSTICPLITRISCWLLIPAVPPLQILYSSLGDGNVRFLLTSRYVVISAMVKLTGGVLISCCISSGLWPISLPHSSYLLQETSFLSFQQQIVDGLQQVEEKLAAITTAVKAIETQEGGFLEQVGAVRREIEATVQQLMQQLMRELDQVTDN